MRIGNSALTKVDRVHIFGVPHQLLNDPRGRECARFDLGDR